ncbi:MAG: hypothetical protein QHJ82_13185, partial [Verrucomicrobiota bacterium]|nr:hypothetical protein [Verrucomicrobiota bacterium]
AIEARARSVVGLMRPGTAALPGPLLFPAGCRSAGILARPQPVNVRAQDSCNRSSCKIGRLVDAAGDGRAPGAVATSNAMRDA